MDDAALEYYSRHLLLNEWGEAAQAALSAAHVLIVGAGGLGCPAAHALATAGVGSLSIADGDVVEASNLQRQTLHTPAWLGQPKVASIQAALSHLNPRCTVQPISTRLSGAALDAAVAGADLVLDCTDNFATRHAINRACVAAGKPLFMGAAIRFDGQWAVFDTRQPTSPCYHCVFPLSKSNEDDDADRCGVMGVYAPLTQHVGNTLASAAIRWITGVGQVALGELSVFNALNADTQVLRVPRVASCAVCEAR